MAESLAHGRGQAGPYHLEYLLDDIVVSVWPEPATFQLPPIHNVPHKVERFGLDLTMGTDTRDHVL